MFRRANHMKDRSAKRISGAPIYLVVIACVLAAFGISWVLRDQQTRVVFVLAIVAAAALGGYRAGLLAAVLSTVMGAVFLTPHESSTHVLIGDGIRFVCFVSVALIVAWITHARQRVAERSVDLQ